MDPSEPQVAVGYSKTIIIELWYFRNEPFDNAEQAALSTLHAEKVGTAASSPVSSPRSPT